MVRYYLAHREPPAQVTLSTAEQIALLQEAATLNTATYGAVRELAGRVRAVMSFRRARLSGRARRRGREEIYDVTETGVQAHRDLLVRDHWTEDSVPLGVEEIQMLVSLSRRDWLAVCEMEHRYGENVGGFE